MIEFVIGILVGVAASPWIGPPLRSLWAAMFKKRET